MKDERDVNELDSFSSEGNDDNEGEIPEEGRPKDHDAT
jgi:hypothetical protein